MADARAALDELDRNITDLLVKRFRYIDAVARIKQTHRQIRDETRIAVVIDQVQARAEAQGAPSNLLAGIYRNLIEASIEYELEKFEAAHK